MQLADIRADLCLLGTSALHPTEGLTDTDWEINQLKKAMLAASKKTAILCISEKLNIALRLKVSGLENINYLVTELSKEEKQMEEYQIKSIEIL